jgi:hypothetical protein
VRAPYGCSAYPPSVTSVYSVEMNLLRSLSDPETPRVPVKTLMAHRSAANSNGVVSAASAVDKTILLAIAPCSVSNCTAIR